MAELVPLYERKCVDYELPAHSTFGPVGFRITQVGYDFTGTSIRIQVRKSKNAPAISTETPVPITSTVGEMTFAWEISASDLDVAAGTYRYDVRITFPDGKIRRYLYGTIRILEAITDTQ